MKRNDNRKILYISLIFIVLAVMYFTPADVLGSMLPEKMIKFRIAYPVAALAVMGAYLGLGWKFVLAFLFSCTGDAMGAYGSFVGQMGYFALAHAMLIWTFAERLRKGRKTSATGTERCNEAESIDFWSSKTWKALVGVASVTALAFSFTLIIPKIPTGSLEIGCGVYTALIVTMFALALVQRSPFFALGAALFLISDIILAWNIFVSPVVAEKWLIMIPYYLGQLLIWLGAVGSTRQEDAEFNRQ